MSSSIGQFAQIVWEELGSPSSPTVVFISGWAEHNIGQLNVKLDTDFSISGLSFSPEFGNAESGIYKEMFNVRHYERKIRDTLSNIVDTSTINDWVSLKEGDSSIQRGNRNEVVKSYRGLRSDAYEELTRMIREYRFNTSGPRQILGDEHDE